ncbi:hypothetical protein [Streptomyces orinoci]|uniref:Uncharacterized protein n=1 Tax=Streptomyces orinoci TaxID=67339 RepID=A0ABV3K2Y8_STRON|nr:hypothetical protein [Streptomyces orinoci]
MTATSPSAVGAGYWLWRVRRTVLGLAFTAVLASLFYDAHRSVTEHLPEPYRLALNAVQLVACAIALSLGWTATRKAEQADGRWRHGRLIAVPLLLPLTAYLLGALSAELTIRDLPRPSRPAAPSRPTRPPAPDKPRWSMRLGALFILLMALGMGGYAGSSLPYALGWSGTQGTLTVTGTYCSYTSRGGCSVGSTGTFRSDDGRTVDPTATIDTEYRVGRHVAVSRDGGTYYSTNASAACGWLAALSFSLCLLCAGLPGVLLGRRITKEEHPKAARWTTRVLTGAFCAAVVLGVGALVIGD